MADPPAESPSTKYISHSSGFFSWQSANLPGNPIESITPFLLVISLAFLAASLALAASTILLHITLASWGCSNKNSVSLLPTTSDTTGCTSLDTSLSLVCDENFGSGTLMDKTQVKPSLISSPDVSTFAFFAISLLSIYALIVLVIAAFKPVR